MLQSRPAMAQVRCRPIMFQGQQHNRSCSEREPKVSNQFRQVPSNLMDVLSGRPASAWASHAVEGCQSSLFSVKRR